jgi:Fe2+ transport system protein B
MSYDEAIQILIRDQNTLKNIGLIFEAWLDTTLEHIDSIYGAGTTQYNNFFSLKSEYKTSKIITKDLQETNNYFANRANQQLGGLIEQLKRARNSSFAKQKQEEEERKQKEEQEKNKPTEKSFSEKLKKPKQEQMDRKYYKIGIALFWTVTIPMIAGIFYFGYFVGTAKFDKEKNDYYDEITSLKKDTSKLIEQIKLKDSLITKYEALTVAFF